MGYKNNHHILCGLYLLLHILIRNIVPLVCTEASDATILLAQSSILSNKPRNFYSYTNFKMHGMNNMKARKCYSSVLYLSVE